MAEITAQSSFVGDHPSALSFSEAGSKACLEN